MNTMIWNLTSDFNRANDAVFLIDVDSHSFRYVNDFICKKLGYSRDELLQMRIRDIDPLMDEISFQKIIKEVRTQGFFLIETYHRSKEGHLFPVEVGGNEIEYNGEVLIICIGKDITNRKYVEEDKQRLIDILEESVDFVGSADMQGNLLYHNRAARQMLGLPDNADLSALSIADMYPKWVLKLIYETAIPTILAQKVWCGETALLHRDGHETPVFQTLVLHRDASGRPEFMSTIMHNLTDRKQKEAQLALLDYAFNSVDEAIFLINSDAQFLQVNEKACQSLGYSRDELLRMGIFDIDPDFTCEDWKKLLDEYEKGKKSITIETRHRTKDGVIFPIEVCGHYIAYQGQKYSFAVVRDITERKTVEKQLTLLNYALDHIKEEVWLIDENARFHYVNQAACRSIGRPKEEMLQLGVLDIKPDYSLEQWKEDSQRSKTAGFFTFETSHQSKEGDIFPVEVNANHFVFDGEHYNLALSHNITERKAVEKQLTLLNYALDHIGESVWLIDENAKFHYNNNEVCRLIGYTREELLSLGVPDVDPDFPFERWSEHWQALKAKGSITLESRLKTKGGHIFPVEVKSNFFEFDGESYNLAFVRDITERQRIENTLKFVAQRGWKDRNESFLVALTQYLAQLFQVDYVIIDKLGTLPSQAETVALCVKGAIVPNLRYDLKGTPCADVVNGRLCCYPERIQQLFPDDALLVEMQAESYAGLPLWDTAGNVLGLIAVLDSKPFKTPDFITPILQLVATSVAAELERQHSEQALLDSRHFLEQVINTIADPVFVKDKEHRWVLLNQAFCGLIGQPLEKLQGKSDYDFFPTSQADIFWAKDEAVFSSGAENTNEEEFTDANGLCRTIITKKTCYTDSKGDQFLVGVITDITGRKRMEDELAAREREFRTLAENVPDNLLRYDVQCRLRYMNQATLTGLAKVPAIGETPTESFPDNEATIRLENAIKHVVDTGESYDIEISWPNADGKIGTHHIRAVAERDSDDKIIGVLAIGRDITERKRMMEVLAAREREFRILVETSPAPIFRYDTQCRRIYVNPAVEKMTGKTAAQLLNRVPSDASVLSKSEGKKLESVLRQVIQTGQAAEGEIECVNVTGETRYYYNRYAPELDAKGNVLSVILVAMDITERRHTEQLLYQREQEFRTLVDNLPTTVLRYDRHLQHIYANPAYLQMIGCNETVLRHKSIDDVWQADSLSVEAYKAILQKVMRDGEKQEVSLEWTDRNGKLICHVLKIVPEYAIDGQIQSVLVLGFDLSERRRQQMIEANRQHVFEKMAQNSSLKVILEQVALYVESVQVGQYCAILLFDKDKNYLQGIAAPSFPESYYTKSHVLSLDAKSKHCYGWSTSASCKKRVIIENIHEHVCGSPCQSFIQEMGVAACWSEPIISSTNQLLGVVTLYLKQTGKPTESDLAHLQKAGHLSAIAIERKHIEKQMLYQASYDILTGLPNRRLFNDRLQEEIIKAERSGYKLAVLFIDLDHFKDINDTLGHEIGDNLLIHAAQRIQSCVRKSDTVARLGGDEFVVIFPGVDKLSSLERMAEAIIIAMTPPFILDEYSTYISASVGIAVYPEDGNNVETLMRCADQAMYSAKESGRNNFNFFTSSMQEQAQQRLYLVNSLRSALEKAQFEVYYQPIIEVASGKAVKAEALLRWHHPTLGMVSPAVFIPLAEETDLIQDIGSWIFCQAADMAKCWNALTGENEPRKVSINMSPRQLIKGSGDQIAIDYLQEIGLDPNYVVVEITEGLLLDNSLNITEKLERLTSKGIELSLDDFGTGYSAMAYLKKFDINYLKVDRSFVRELETNVNDRAIAEAIIVMAHRLGLKVIAEGVETEGQKALLAAVGCEYLQGYFYAKPMPIEAFFSYVLK